MTHWCESCGQELPDGETTSDATWLGAPAVHQHSFAKPGVEKKSGREKKLILAVLATFAVWGAFVGIGSIVTPADTIDEQAATELEDARLERDARAAQDEAEAAQREEAAAADSAATDDVERPGIAQVAGDYGAADAAPGIPTMADDASRAVSVAVERLQRQLTRRDSAAFVAYRSGQGVVVIDLVGGVSYVSDLAPGISAPYVGAQLLRSGSSTYAIDASTLQVTRVAENSSIVVSDTLDGHTYLVDSGASSGQGALVEVIADGEYGFHRLAALGLQLQPVDGLGLVAVPPGASGQTLLAGVDSFSILTENRVLTGTANALLEQVCSTEASCSLVITGLSSGDQYVVAPSFVRVADQYSLAPDGHALARYSPQGFAEIYVAETEAIQWLVGEGMRAPAWSPDSDFIAWIDRSGDPKLKVMFPDERDWITIDLRDLGAPSPASAELIVFTSDQSLPAAPPDES